MKKKELELMIIISKRGMANKIVSATKDLATFPSIILSKGTASSEIMNALGIGEPEKDMIFCFCERDKVEYIYNLLSGEFKFKEKHNGIAMTIPVSAVAGNLTLQILLGKTKDLM